MLQDTLGDLAEKGVNSFAVVIGRHKFPNNRIAASVAGAAADRGVGEETDPGDGGAFFQGFGNILFDLVEDGGVGGAGEVAGIVFIDPATFVHSKKFGSVFEAFVPYAEEFVVVVVSGP